MSVFILKDGKLEKAADLPPLAGPDAEQALVEATIRLLPDDMELALVRDAAGRIVLTCQDHERGEDYLLFSLASGRALTYRVLDWAEGDARAFVRVDDTRLGLPAPRDA